MQVSEEVYEETGPNQPVVLPHCGHTLSRDTVGKIIRNSVAPIACPMCTVKQLTLRLASDCPPNWDTIKRLGFVWVKKRRREQPRRVRFGLWICCSDVVVASQIALLTQPIRTSKKQLSYD